MIRRNEQVYVVPREELFPRARHPAGAPRGFLRLDAALLERIYARGRFVPRDPAEHDPSLKQIIPYTLVVDGGRIFTFQRTDKGGERRLYGMRSVGVGGHVNPVDRADVVRDALARELNEELHLPGGFSARLVGLLNDDTTSVGRVHVGVVALAQPGPGVVKVREEDTMSGSFLARDELLELHAGERDRFESWSALLIDRLDEVLACPPIPPPALPGSSSPTRNPTRTSST